MPINEIQSGRFNAILAKLLNIKTGAPSPSLATDVFPVIVLEANDPSWAYLGGERLLGGYAEQGAGGAGLTSHVQLENPAGSGVICVVEWWAMQNPNAVAYNIVAGLGNTQSLGSVVTTEYSRDSRLTQKGAANIRVFTNATPLVNPTFTQVIAAYESVMMPVKMVVSPGGALTLYNVTQNVGVGAWFSWRERFLEPSETR